MISISSKGVLDVASPCSVFTGGGSGATQKSCDLESAGFANNDTPVALVFSKVGLNECENAMSGLLLHTGNFIF